MSVGASSLSIIRAEHPVVQAESPKTPTVAVPATLDDPHPLLVSWFAEAKALDPDWTWLDEISESRRIRVLSGLLAALEKRGHALRRPANSLWPIQCEIEGERIEISICEVALWQPIQPRSRKNATGSTPSVRLSLEIHHRNKTRHWDENGKPLERQLGVIIRTLENRAAAHIAAERRTDEHVRSYNMAAERYRRRVSQRAHEAACWSNLQNAAINHENARRLREFVAEVMQGVLAMPHPPANTATWLKWAQARIENLDPLSGGVAPFLEPFANVGVALPQETLTEEDRVSNSYVRDDIMAGIFE